MIVILIADRRPLDMLRVNASLVSLASAGLEGWFAELLRALHSRLRAASALTLWRRVLLMVICRRLKAVCKEVLRLIDSSWPGFKSRCS